MTVTLIDNYIEKTKISCLKKDVSCNYKNRHSIEPKKYFFNFLLLLS